MPIRQGYESGAVLSSGQITPGLTSNLSDYEFVVFGPGAFYVCNLSAYNSGTRFAILIAESAPRIKSGYRLKNWADDYYDRIYVTPTFIDLGTIVSPQTRPIEVWNAWRDTSAQLQSIIINGTQVNISGDLPPFTFLPLQYSTYQVNVSSSGAPDVNAEVIFDFANVPNPSSVIIVGTRAVRFGIVPEVPVREKWSWLTDVMVATDGTEQRVAVRGEVPRVELSMEAVFTSKKEVNDFYGQMITSRGRLWIPEYQYLTQTTADATAGSDTIFVDVSKTDIRAGEYFLVDTKVASFLIGADSINPGFIKTVSALPFPVPKGAMICPGSPSLLSDGTGIDRYAVDWAASTQLNCRFQRYRTALVRPGAPSVVSRYLSSAMLERRPLADAMVAENFYTGQEEHDNKTGIIDMLTHWDYTRVGGPRKFKIDRVKNPAEMDYWREFLSWCRGKARMFWMSSYRSDYTFTTPPLSGGTTATISGEDFAFKLFPIQTHRHLEITTAAGKHLVRVTAAVAIAGDSGISFTPALPIGPDWEDIKNISQLLPLRLDSDEVKWDHHGLESFLELSIRTAEDQL